MERTDIGLAQSGLCSLEVVVGYLFDFVVWNTTLFRLVCGTVVLPKERKRGNLWVVPP